MQKLILILALVLPAYTVRAASTADTSFMEFERFARLSKKEIRREFGRDEEASKLIKEHYSNRSRGVAWVFPAIALNGGGIYFAHISSTSTNGMGSVVGLVLAICLILPGLISLFLFLNNFLFRKKPSRRVLYNSLREHFGSKRVRGAG